MHTHTYKIIDRHLEYFKNPINQDIIEEWAEALCSGEYSQAKEFLYNKQFKGFCCLGVLEHAVNNIPKDILQGAPVPSYIDEEFIQLYSENESETEEEIELEILPEELCIKGENGDYFSLASLNDRRLLTFEQIAWLLINHEVTVPVVTEPVEEKKGV